MASIFWAHRVNSEAGEWPSSEHRERDEKRIDDEQVTVTINRSRLTSTRQLQPFSIDGKTKSKKPHLRGHQRFEGDATASEGRASGDLRPVDVYRAFTLHHQKGEQLDDEV